jgi:protein disulfide-isomerase
LPPIICALLLVGNTPARAQGPYDQAADARKDIATALSQAGADHKLVLLDFGANWCLDCVVLSKLFEDETVQPFLRDHFHMVSIDVGQWDRNLDVSRQYGSPIDSGIPAVVVLAPDGRIIASTKNGALADARTATAKEILGYLKGWVAQNP